MTPTVEAPAGLAAHEALWVAPNLRIANKIYVFFRTGISYFFQKTVFYIRFRWCKSNLSNNYKEAPIMKLRGGGRVLDLLSS